MSNANTNKKRIIGKAMIVFLVIMLLLTFFSNTLNNFLSPRVSFENPDSGQLVKEITGMGKVRAKAIIERYTETEMKVLDVKVRAGEAVEKGQLILELDTSGILEQILYEKTVLQQKKLNLEKLEDESSVEGQRYYDNDIESARLNMDRSSSKYEKAKLLYDAGAESEVNVKSAEADYQNSQMDYQKALDNKEAAAKSNKRDMQNAQYELDMQERKLEKYMKQIDLSQIVAPADGIIMELNFPKGTMANNSKPLFKLVDTSQGFEFCTTIGNEAASLLSIGDAADIYLDCMEGYTLQGTINDIVENQEERGVKKDVIMDLPPENLIGGENGSVEIKKNTRSYNVLVSNSAVGQDISGYFVYVIREKKGPLGNEFYVQKVKVSPGESDNSMTVIVSGVSSYDRVITGSDKQISDGMRVIIGSE
jgi:multidrug efflux pump subunit AcrA (membrane-fusion protein)